MDFFTNVLEKVRLEPEAGSFTHQGGFNRFSNKDLDPVKPEQRKWRWYHVGGFWISEGFNIAQMQTIGTGISLGLNPGLAMVACLLGNLLVTIPCCVSGYLGAKYGLNFPVIIRSSFGLWGSYWAVLVRGGFAACLYGVQAVLAATAVEAMISAIWPSFPTWHAGAVPASLGISAAGLLSYFLFWMVSFPFLFLSIPQLRWFFIIKIVIVPFFYVGLLTWGLTAGQGATNLFSLPTNIKNGWTTGYAFCYLMTASIAGNATFALNMADVCRYAVSTGEGWKTQAVMLPVCITLTELLGAVLAAASQVVYGDLQFNAAAIILLWDNRAAKFFVGFFFAFCNIGTNIAGNSVPFANDLMAWFPRYINIRRGQVAAALVGLIIQPYLITGTNSGSTFLAFINGYSTFLGPIAGIMIAENMVIHRKVHLNVYELYRPHGVYWYWHGFNWKAFAAFFAAFLPNFPGLIQSMGVDVTNRGIVAYFCEAWLTGTTIAFLVYLLLNVPYGPFKPIVIPENDDSMTARVLESQTPPENTHQQIAREKV